MELIGFIVMQDAQLLPNNLKLSHQESKKKLLTIYECGFWVGCWKPWNFWTFHFFLLLWQLPEIYEWFADCEHWNSKICSSETIFKTIMISKVIDVQPNCATWNIRQKNYALYLSNTFWLSLSTAVWRRLLFYFYWEKYSRSLFLPMTTMFRKPFRNVCDINKLNLTLNDD